MNVKIIGVIHTLFPEETIGTFSKRVVWVAEQEVTYPNTYAVEFVQGKIGELNGYKNGDLVEITADLTGRHVEKAGKEYVFVSLKGWKIAKLNGAAQAAPSNRQQTGGAQAPAGTLSTAPGDDDDLPF